MSRYQAMSVWCRKKRNDKERTHDGDHTRLRLRSAAHTCTATTGERERDGTERAELRTDFPVNASLLPHSLPQLMSMQIPSFVLPCLALALLLLALLVQAVR